MTTDADAMPDDATPDVAAARARAHAAYHAGDIDGCHEQVMALLSADPGDWQAATLLAAVYAAQDRQVEASGVLRQLLPFADRIPRLYQSLAVALYKSGDPDEAVAFLERELRQSGRRDTFINYLFTLGYAPGTTMATLRRQTELFHHQNVANAGITPFEHRPGPGDTPDKRLRVGYISGHFNWFQYMGFVHPILCAHDPERIQPVCLSLHPDDQFSHVYGGRVEVHRIDPADAAVAASACHDLDIDILVDLIGVDPAGQFDIVAHRPGKIQLVWQNSTGTTGNPAIDYSLGDALLIPPHHDPHYSETVLRVPTVNVAYHAYVPLPDPVPPPCLTAGRVTFGSLSLMHKVNRHCIDLWARVLHAVPDSRFVLRNGALKDPKLQRKLLAWFAAAGIAADRITVGPTPLGPGYLQHYAEIDIALGTVPVNGGTTVTEALHVGVPMLSLDWDTCLGLTGREILTAVGLGDWACPTAADLVATAAALAADRQGLADFRAGFRDRIVAERLFDAATLVREAEAVFRRIWQDWLARHAGAA